MHIFVSHETVYRYDRPVSGIIQILRLTPRDHDGQHVNRWRIDVSKTCRLVRHEDAFGNVTHVLAVDGPLAELRVAVDGEVDTKDTSGIVRDAVERFPSSQFLRATPLTAPDPAIVDFAKETREAAGDEMLNVLHHLLLRLHRELAYDLNSTRAATTAAEAFALKRGVCQDLAHIFIAAARCLGIPARYVGGHLHRVDGVTEQEAGHAWAEAFVPDLGWVAFDPANGICATEAHVRVAIGLDYLGAAPVRGSRYGGGSETLEVAVRVDQAAQQVQS